MAGIQVLLFPTFGCPHVFLGNSVLLDNTYDTTAYACTAVGGTAAFTVEVDHIS